MTEWINKQANKQTNINILKPSGYNMYFVFMGFISFSLQIVIISLNSVNQMIFVMVKCGVLFEVRTAFLNIV
jgi:hypothetical protein